MKKILKSTSRGYKHLSRTLRAPINRWTAFKRLREFHSKSRSLEELVACAMNFRTTGYFRVATVQIESEILALVEVVAALKPAVIVEIGTAEGGTCFLWANLASKKVISCDLKHKEHSGDFYKAFPPPGSACDVTLSTGDSHQQMMKDRLVQQLDGERIDFLFVDGDHTELGVEKDYDMYRDLVRPGGLIAFHDIVEKQPVASTQVHYFWRRLQEKADTEEFIEDADQCGFGIGIVRQG